jgi:hypothetical protein
LRRKGGEGDLETVEEHSGALDVDVVEGDGVHDLGDGGAGAVAVLGVGEIEDVGSASALAGTADGAAGGVVVVAEVFAAEGGAAAAVAVGEDVSALVAFLVLPGVGHVVSPSLG